MSSSPRFRTVCGTKADEKREGPANSDTEIMEPLRRLMVEEMEDDASGESRPSPDAAYIFCMS